ncbi:MAG: hypothetical protein OEY01_03400 [Desulfobulbaceae bacterium]|nr:hypothetical protein [Desulfobulbaceae bacterium]
MVTLEALRVVIFEVFEDHIAPSNPKWALERIKEGTFTGETDPGEWCPEAAFIVHTENGIPSGYYYPGLHTLWEEVCERCDLHLEYVNAAVIALCEP